MMNKRTDSAMLQEAVGCEMVFAQDVLVLGVAGLSIKDMRQYLEYVADQRLAQLGLPKFRCPAIRFRSWNCRTYRS